jgi:hypothetical protein
MTSYKRFGNRWTVNECLQLQREFELLHLSVDEISEIHQRTPNAIMCKLDQEGLANYNVLYSNYHNLNSEMSIQRTSNYDGSDDEQDEDNEKESDGDNSSNYSEQDCAEEHCSDDEEDEDLSDDESHDNSSLKHHVLRLEKQLNALTEMMLKQNKGNKFFSLFG